MTGCVTLRKDVYYIRLSYYDKNHKRKDKFISTGLSGRGAKGSHTKSELNALADRIISYGEEARVVLENTGYYHW